MLEAAMIARSSRARSRRRRSPSCAPTCAPSSAGDQAHRRLGPHRLLADFHVVLAAHDGQRGAGAACWATCISRCVADRADVPVGALGRALVRRARRDRRCAGAPRRASAPSRLMDRAPAARRAQPAPRPRVPDLDVWRLMPAPEPAMTHYDHDRPLPARPASATAATRRMRSWPGSARIAVQFVLNYEEGGENSVLHGDAGSRDSSCPRCSTAPAYADRHLTHGVDLRVRLARRRLAHPARVREARPAAHGVRRGDGAAAPPRADAPPSWSSATRSPATAGAGSTTRTCDEATEREHMRLGMRHHRAS